ncbi:DUF5685 family protein [Clostridium sp. SHJSY1]|uniref:DUF5685 family protein n=1 Tax=Clostridium sp. SHJSY1 TaxID=2942483 RepID=UPI002875611A|nr:DUF5685 family protein [Clostridium sp. SHJSY1]MDS0524407.1 DUF5685 family protein [Clostridium sp. SHJSY1]
MFGYITLVKDELKVKDLETFRHYYCGLCMCIKKKFGNPPRMGLNYDVTFFAVLLDSLYNETTKTYPISCIRHPINKRVCISENPPLIYSANLNIALIYYNALDDVIDDNNLASKTLSLSLQLYKRKLAYKNIDNIIKNNLEELHLIEISNCSYQLDEIAHPFGHIIGEILKEAPFTLNIDTAKTRNSLYSFGYAFGKWIYLIDALDDLKEDMENGKFNPIEKAYNKYNLPYEDFIKKIKENLDFLLMGLAMHCSDLIKELPISKNEGIIDNVINRGLIEKYMNISYKL